MTTINNQEFNILAAGSAQPLVSADSASTQAAPNSVVVVDQVDGNTDVIQTSGVSASTANAENKRTADELYKKLLTISNKYNLSSDEVKRIFEKVSGTSETELLNFEENEITKLINIINKAVEILNVKKEDVNADSIISLSKNLKIRVDNQWSLEGAANDIINQPRQESLADKLRRSFPAIFKSDYDFTDPNNREQIKKYVQAYIEMTNRDAHCTITDYAKMLACSKNDAERDVFDAVLREIDPEYRAQFVKSWLYSYDSDEARMNAANRTDISEIAEGTNNESTKEIAHVVRKNQSEEGVKKSDEKIFNETDKYYEENNLKEIIEKAANGAELTEKEQAIYEKWQHIEALISGATTGTIANEYISTEFKEQHLHNFVNPKIFSYGEISYRNIINEVSKYFSNHPEELKNTEINLTELLNKVTDGNYEIIVSGDKNAVLNAPGSAETSASNTAATSSSENASSCRTDLGFATKPTPVQKAEPQKTETTEKSAKEDEKITEEKAIKGGLVELDAYTQKMSLKEKVLFILTKKNKDVQARQRGYNLLSRATDSVQKDIYENDIRDGSVKAGILAHHVLSDSVVEKLNATSYIESQSLKIAQKEIKEEKERKHKFTNSIMDNANFA